MTIGPVALSDPTIIVRTSPPSASALSWPAKCDRAPRLQNEKDAALRLAYSACSELELLDGTGETTAEVGAIQPFQDRHGRWHGGRES